MAYELGSKVIALVGSVSLLMACADRETAIDESGGSGETTGSETVPPDAGDDPTGDGDYPFCMGPVDDTDLRVNVTPEVPFGGVTLSCRVMEVTVDGPDTEIEIDCEDDIEIAGGQFVISISSSPALDLALAVGQEVDARMVPRVELYGTTIRTSVTLSDSATGELELAAIDDYWLDPNWAFNPFSVSVFHACPPVVDESQCLKTERVALDISIGNEVSRVLDGRHLTMAAAPEYEISVTEAVEGEYVECIDVPASAYRLLIARTRG